MPEISIVIRAKNEARHLPALLDGIAGQSERSVEVVLVDSGSTDATVSIARGRRIRVETIPAEEFTFGRSLNIGVRAATAPLVAVVSAHTRPVHERWLESLLRPLRENPKIAMVYGRQIGWDTSKFAETLDFDRFFGGEAKEVDEHFFANNANSALRKSLWGLHPFDEGLPGLEDIEWARWWRARGWRVAYAHDAPIHHIHEETWEQVRRRYFREGIAARRIGWLRRRDLPVELWGELKWLSRDLIEASKRGLLSSKLGEILRFRLNKVAGTVAGVWSEAAKGEP
ncbi:MAG: glycosyltransferase [Elusimicrobia bacterium]|nr:glycosyltransferase [Elusimicrobiota bacterium]